MTEERRYAWVGDDGRVPDRMALRAGAFWAQMSEGVWDVEARAFSLNEARSKTCLPSLHHWCNNERRRQLAEEGYNATHSYIVGGYSRGAGGVANMPGRSGAIFSNGSLNAAWHETGHNEGLGHSNTIDKDGNIREYKDTSTVMGSRSPGTGLSAVQALFLSFPRAVWTDVKDAATVRLVPWEMHLEARHRDEVSLARIPGPPEGFHSLRYGDFWVCLRPHKGYPYIPTLWRPGAPARPVVQIIYARATGRSMATYLVDELDLGESTDLVPGRRITHTFHSEGGSQVAIDLIGKNKAIVDPVGGGFPEREQNLIDPSGMWWHPKMGGQGFDVHTKGERAVLYWYTFTDSGTRDWMFATWDWQDTDEFVIYRVEGARQDDPSRGKPVEIGSGRFRVQQAKRFAVFDFITEDHGRNSIPLTFLAGSNHPQDGLYFNEQRNNEGLAIRFIGDKCYGFWYDFYHEGGPRWYHLEGDRVEPRWVMKASMAKGVFMRYNIGEYMRLEDEATLEPQQDGQWKFTLADFTTTLRRLF